MAEQGIIQMGGNNGMMKVETNQKDRFKAQRNIKVMEMLHDCGKPDRKPKIIKHFQYFHVLLCFKFVLSLEKKRFTYSKYKLNSLIQQHKHFLQHKRAQIVRKRK